MSDEIIPIPVDPRGRSPLWEMYGRYLEKVIEESILLPMLRANGLLPRDPHHCPTFTFDVSRKCEALIRIPNQCRALVGPVRR